MVHSTSRHQFISPQTKMSSQTSKIFSENLLTITDRFWLFDKISPITPSGENVIVLYEYTTLFRRHNDAKKGLVQCNEEGRWRAEAYHASPCRPSRKLQGSEQIQGHFMNCCHNVQEQSLPKWTNFHALYSMKLSQDMYGA